MPTVTVDLPTPHPGQIEVALAGSRLNAVCCGRRWGKTKQLVTAAAKAAASKRKVGVFAPEHRQLAEPYDEILWLLRNVKERSNKTDGTIKCVGGGGVDFWTLTDNQLAGRGREYDLILVDEGAFTKNGQMLDIWHKSIAPTMITRPNSRAWVFSTPNGIDETNFFWQICHDPKLKFKFHHAPTSGNPYVPASELERERETNHPLVYQQEFLAQFVDWSGVAFFSIDKALVDGHPVPVPTLVDTVFAVIDTAVKDRSEHDGTAVSYVALSKHVGHPMVLLDWDVISIQGALLEAWLPTVFARLEEFTRTIRTRFGVAGAFIEDKASGTILLQQALNRGLKAYPIDSKLTSLGKSERALNVSGYWHQGLFKITQPAFDKTVNYKGIERNHWLSQVTGFRLGDKDDRRADDLLDTATYSMAIGLGNPEGF